MDGTKPIELLDKLPSRTNMIYVAVMISSGSFERECGMRYINLRYYPRLKSNSTFTCTSLRGRRVVDAL
jgi:hypothetical protein